MKFDRRKDPAVFAEATRFASTPAVGVATYQGANYLGSTDGHAAIFVAMEGEALPEGRMIPAAAIKEARSEYAVMRTEDGRVIIGGSAIAFPLAEQRFPDLAGVVPQGAVAKTITVDAALLVKAQKALGASAITIEIRADGLPLLVRPSYLPKDKAERDGSFAVVMPHG